jgi:hypothetical protein
MKKYLARKRGEYGEIEKKDIGEIKKMGDISDEEMSNIDSRMSKIYEKQLDESEDRLLVVAAECFKEHKEEQKKKMFDKS